MTSAPVRALVALDVGVDRAMVEASLTPVDEVHVVGFVEGLDQTWQILEETPTDILVVACAGYSDRAVVLVDASVKQRPDRPVVILCQGSSNGFVRRAFEAGAEDFLSLPQPAAEISFALQKALARRQGNAAVPGTASARMISVLGPKGGTGKTLTSCNLAVALATSEQRVALVDLDLQFGDVGLSLGLSPEQTIYDLVRSGGSLDAEKLDAYLLRHPSGVRALLAPTRPDQAAAVEVEFLRELYSILRASYDFVVVDTPPGFTPEVIASIDSSTDICMVGTLDSLSLKNTKLGLETLELMGVEPDRVRIVLNRADSRVGITRDDVVTVLGRDPDVMIPSDGNIPRYVNEATAVVTAGERSEAARSFRGLADMYMAQRPVKPVEEARGGRVAFLRRRA